VNYVAGTLSMRLRFVPVSWTNSFAGLLIRRDGSNNTDLVFSTDTSGNLNFMEVAADTYGITATSNFALGQVCELVFTRGTGANNFVPYTQGVALSPATFSSTAAVTAALQIGHDPFSSSRVSDIKVLIFQTWLRPLTASEVKQMWIDPLCMMSPQLEVIPSIKTPIAVSGIKMRKTLSQIGGRIGSRQSQGWGS